MLTWEEARNMYREQIDREVRRIIKLRFLPALKEVGFDDVYLSHFQWHPDEIAGVLIATIREQRARLDIARKEFRKIQRQQAKDSQTVMSFLRAIEEGGKLL